MSMSDFQHNSYIPLRLNLLLPLGIRHMYEGVVAPSMGEGFHFGKDMHVCLGQ